MFKRNKTHKQSMHNPKPKKNKYENTWKENFRATLMEEVERKFIEREKFFNKKNIKLPKRNVILK